MNRAAIPMALAAVLLMSAASARAESAASELESLLDRFLAAASINDVAMHQRFWSDDLIYTSSSGERFGKDAILDGLADAEPANATPTYHAEDLTVQHLGDVAVVTFRLIASGPGETRETYFNTGVFRRENDQWRAFVWQATRAASEDV